MKTKFFTLAFGILGLYGFSQPTLIKDIDTYCCLGGSLPSNLFVYNNLIYFSAHDNSGSNSPGNLDLGSELWVSDGTTDGTILLKDLNNGSANSSPNNFFVYNNNLYFTANSGSGNVLFTSNGTEGGTIATGIGAVQNIVELDGLIYHINPTGNKLNQFNGISSSAVAGSGNELIVNNQFVAYNNKIFCYLSLSSQSGTYGSELYAYDPNTDSFSLVKDVISGQIESEIQNFTVLGSDLYFTVFQDTHLWKTDGTNGGTIEVDAVSAISGLANFYSWNGKLFFEGDDGSGDQLWVYDPVGDSVSNISNLTGTFSNHDPSDYLELDGWLYYRGEDSNDNDGHLWRTDGTETFQLDNTIKLNQNVSFMVALNNKIYFRGDNGTVGFELFAFDPATLSINSVLNNQMRVFPNPTSSYINVSSNEFIDSIEIYDVQGKKVLTAASQNQIDISNLNSGLYLIKLYSGIGLVTKKIIIK